MSTNSSTIYDVAIIGSGIGGLLCAALLSKAGQKVLVIEKNKQIGGALQTYAFQKQVFDTCVHYIGGLHPGQPLYKLFEYLGILSELNIQTLDSEGFDHFYFAKEGLHYQMGERAAFEAYLKTHFPKEHNGIDAYFKLIDKVNAPFHLYHLRNGDPLEKQAFTSMGLKDCLNQLFVDPRIKAVICGNALLYAGEADTTPFYLHSLIMNSYWQGAHKIHPGSSSIAKALHRVLLQQGGELIKNTEVRSIAHDQQQVQHLVLANGECVFAKQFISNIHPVTTLSLLNEPLTRAAYSKRLLTHTQTVSPLLINLVLKPDTLPYFNHNIYWHASIDTVLSTNATAFDTKVLAIYPNANGQQSPYLQTLSLLTYTDWETFAPFQDSYQHKGCPTGRPDAYQTLKDDLAKHYSHLINKILPNTQGQIQAVDVATPLTFRDYLHKPLGSIYGNKKDYHAIHLSQLSSKTKLSNLHLTGENIGLHGVLGVALSALTTTGHMLGLDNLLEQIHKK